MVKVGCKLKFKEPTYWSFSQFENLHVLIKANSDKLHLFQNPVLVTNSLINLSKWKVGYSCINNKIRSKFIHHSSIFIHNTKIDCLIKEWSVNHSERINPILSFFVYTKHGPLGLLIILWIRSCKFSYDINTILSRGVVQGWGFVT